MHIFEESVSDIFEHNSTIPMVATMFRDFLLNLALEQMHFETYRCILIFIQFFQDHATISSFLIRVKRFSLLIVRSDILKLILLEGHSHVGFAHAVPLLQSYSCGSIQSSRLKALLYILFDVILEGVDNVKDMHLHLWFFTFLSLLSHYLILFFDVALVLN